jgi:glutaminase
MIDIEKIIKTIYDKTKHIKSGKVASYIPQLAKVDPSIFAISMMDCDGNMYSVGDDKKEVAIESISKLFTFSKAVHTFGEKEVIKKIGAHGSSLPFNSVIAEELSPTHTINPFVNQGAMATTSLFYKKNKEDFKEKILHNLREYAGRKLRLGRSVYHSEGATNSTNMGLAYLLKSHGRFYGNVKDSVDVYTAQCSMMVTSRDLATMAAVYAKGGVHPKTGKKLLEKEEVTYILRTLRPEGLYEYSDIWATKNGCVAAKSGVGGGILIAIPGIGGIGIVSPPLDKHGNSVRGIKAGTSLSKKLVHHYNPPKDEYVCKITHEKKEKEKEKPRGKKKQQKKKKKHTKKKDQSKINKKTHKKKKEKHTKKKEKTN